MTQLTLVFVHGYSVTNINTYGELPLRLRNEGKLKGIDISIENIFLGRYISFNDEVKLADISRALETAIQQQILANHPQTRFACITHSTGGPVVRNWWDVYYKNKSKICPMSHLIMLAPANHGSALAQLGKGRLSRIKSWFDGVEPGQGVLNWLELGSNEAWELNKDWITSDGSQISEKGIFPFVLTGQDIDHKLYDHLNSYTGELGSDGVVRVASTNLNSRHIKLTQTFPKQIGNKLVAADLELTEFTEAPATAMRIVTGKAHSGDNMGIMKSVAAETNDSKSTETIKVIFDCISVQTKNDYNKLCTRFENETNDVQQKSRLEIERGILMTRTYIHDRYSMIIFRLKDSEGHPLKDFDLLLTSGDNNDPNELPSGFFMDRQCNRVNQSTITYFLNYDAMCGAAPVIDKKGNVIRPAIQGMDKLGLLIIPRPAEGFIRYLPCKINASRELFEKALKPNSTTLIEICLQRIVSTEVFRFEKLEGEEMPNKSFKNVAPGKDVIK